jgi:hypothetical protein
VVRGSKVELREEAPELYQRIGGEKRRVEGRYLLIDAHTIGFSIGPYDPTRELVIDPVISYCTFLGGSAISAVTGVALDSAGNLYVAGWTEALDFPYRRRGAGVESRRRRRVRRQAERSGKPHSSMRPTWAAGATIALRESRSTPRERRM